MKRVAFVLTAVVFAGVMLERRLIQKYPRHGMPQVENESTGRSSKGVTTVQKYSVLTVLALCAVLCVFPVTITAAAGGYSLFGDAILVPPGSGSPMAVQLASDATVPPGYGGVDFAVPTGTTFADLQTLSTDFNVTDDDCGGGSPRFQINVDTGSGIKNIFAYIGPQPNYTGCIPNTWTNSGDLLDTSRLIDTRAC